MDLVDDRRGPVEVLDHPLRQCEAQVHPVRAEVQEQVARGGDGAVLRPLDRLEGVQVRRPRHVVEPVPELGADRDDEAQTAGGEAEGHRTGEHPGVAEDVADGVLTPSPTVRTMNIAACAGGETRCWVEGDCPGEVSATMTPEAKGADRLTVSGAGPRDG